MVDELRRTIQRYHRYQTVFYSFLYIIFSLHGLLEMKARGSGDEEKLGIRKSRKGRWSIGGKVGGGLGE